MNLITLFSTIVLMAFNSYTYKVSYYGDGFHGKKTTSGEIFDKNKLTCAATDKYKLGSYLEVSNPKTNKTVVVRVNDRGKFKKYGRELDLSEAAFKKIAPVNQGVIRVTIKKL